MKAEQVLMYSMAFGLISLLAIIAVPQLRVAVGLQSVTGGGTTIINQGGAVQTDAQSQWSILLSTMNGENTGTEYIAPTVAVTSLTSNVIVRSTALTGGATETQTALALGKNLIQDGFKAYTLASNPAAGAIGLSGAVQTVQGITTDLSTVKFVKYPTPILPDSMKAIAGNSSYPCFNVKDENSAADNASETQGTNGVRTLSTTTHTIAQNGQVQGYIDVQVNTSSARFGSGHGFYIIAAGGATTTPAAFSEGDITLYTTTAPGDFVITKLAGCVDSNDPSGNALSQAVKNNAPAIACYKANRGLKSSDGKVRLYYSVKASGANPGANDNIVFDFVNIETFMDSDGNVKVGTYNLGNTIQGQAVGALTVDIA